MAFLEFKKGENPQFSSNWQQKLKPLQIFLKIRHTKQKNVFENLNRISFVTWAVPKNSKKVVFCFIFVRQKVKQIKFCRSVLTNWAGNENEKPWKLGTNIIQKSKVFKICHSEYVINQLWFRGSQRCSVLIFNSENFRSKWCSELNQRLCMHLNLFKRKPKFDKIILTGI